MYSITNLFKTYIFFIWFIIIDMHWSYFRRSLLTQQSEVISVIDQIALFDRIDGKGVTWVSNVVLKIEWESVRVAPPLKF